MLREAPLGAPEPAPSTLPEGTAARDNRDPQLCLKTEEKLEGRRERDRETERERERERERQTDREKEKEEEGKSFHVVCSCHLLQMNCLLVHMVRTTYRALLGGLSSASGRGEALREPETLGERERGRRKEREREGLS